jgi:hypothetical protein
MEKKSSTTAEMLRDIFIDYCPEPQRLTWEEAFQELRKIDKIREQKSRNLSKNIKHKLLILQEL